MSHRGLCLAATFWCLALILGVAISTSPAADTSKPAPAKNDELIRYYGSDPDYIQPLLGNDSVSTEFMVHTYERLGRRTFADPDVIGPVLAEKWELDKKNLEYTIRLRKGVKWHPFALPSGKPIEPKEFTARDVKFTFDCILNPNTLLPAARSAFENPDSKDATDKYLIKVTVVDNYTLKVKWRKPYFNMEEATLDVPILPRHVFSVNAEGKPISFDFTSAEYAKGFNEHWANSKMCGTGALIFKEWKKGEHAIFERNPNYWGTPFHFSRVKFEFISNPNTMIEKVKQNKLDWAVIPEKDMYLTLKASDKVKSQQIVAAEYPFPGFRYVGYNLKRPFFKDQKVRHALAHIVPVDQIIKTVLKGLAQPVTGPGIPGSSAYDSSLPPIPYDLAKARALLDEAGWKDSDNDGVRDKLINNQKIDARYDLMCFDSSPTFQSIAEVIKEESRKVGVTVNITPTKWDLMLQKLRKRDYDASMLGWSLPWRSDPLQLWHSSQADVPDSSNAIDYRNPEADKIIDELRVTIDVARQNELYRKLHKVLYDDQPYTFLFSELRTAAQDGRLVNVREYKLRPCINEAEWWSSTARATP